MIQNQLTTEREIKSIGEEIGMEKGAQMIRDFQTNFPGEIASYVVGKEIIEKILSQPGCEGIMMYNALNEFGAKTKVFIGIDCNGKVLLEYTTISNFGELKKENGIVANKFPTKRWERTSSESLDEEINWWGVD